MIREKRKMLSGIEIFKFFVSDHLKGQALRRAESLFKVYIFDWSTIILPFITLRVLSSLEVKYEKQ